MATYHASAGGNGYLPHSNEASSASGAGNSPAVITMRVHVPETKTEKCLQFQLDETVHTAKLKALDQVGVKLADRLNYGLYCPDSRGRAGKFLQEERLMLEYPMTGGPIPDIELRYKRRVYRNTYFSLSKIKRANSKPNLKQFVASIQAGDVGMVNRLLSKGLDPNFHHKGIGATPLMLAAELKRSREMILTLVSGGAHLDFRESSSGLTGMHRAAAIGNADSVQTLLDLGQSPNCVDARGLTPLYHSVLSCGSTVVAEMLLYDGSLVGIRDENGLSEIHQACRLGREHHLELLLIYGADINGATTRGNVPLHICALSNQMECARTLLLRGADKSLKNYQGQTAEDAALLGGRAELADLIRGFSPAEVTPIRAQPRRNQRRRVSTVSARSLGTWTHHQQGSGSWGSVGNLAQAQAQGVAMPTRSPSSMFSRDYSMGQLSDSVSSAGSAMRSPHDLTAARPSLSLPIASSEYFYSPARTVVIQRAASGFGFVLRSAGKAAAVEQQPGASAQRLGSVELGSPAHLAGMRPGDFVLGINGVDVRRASHAECFRLISGADMLSMELLSAGGAVSPSQQQRAGDVRESHSNSVLSNQSAIDLLDRTLNKYDEILQEPPPPALPESPPQERETPPEPPAAVAMTTVTEVPPTTTTTTTAVATAVAVAATTATASAATEEELAASKKRHTREDTAQTADKSSDKDSNNKEEPSTIPKAEPELATSPPAGFGDDNETTVGEGDGRKISTVAPLRQQLPLSTPPPAPPPPPPPPKPSAAASPAVSVAVIRRRSLLAKPAAATPDHDRELRQLVELRRRRLEDGQLDPERQIEAQLNRKSAGSRVEIVPAAAAAAPTVAAAATAAAAPAITVAATASPSSSPVMLRHRPPGVVASAERPSSFTGRAEQLRQQILQQQQQHQKQKSVL